MANLISIRELASLISVKHTDSNEYLFDVIQYEEVQSKYNSKCYIVTIQMKSDDVIVDIDDVNGDNKMTLPGATYRVWSNGYLAGYISSRKPTRKFRILISKEGNVTIPGYSTVVTLQ